MARVIEPTEQQLRDACLRLARRFRWAASFESVMQDPCRSRLVRMAVDHPLAAGPLPPRRPQTPASRAVLPNPRGMPQFDRKRAASGERADD